MVHIYQITIFFTSFGYELICIVMHMKIVTGCMYSVSGPLDEALYCKTLSDLVARNLQEKYRMHTIRNKSVCYDICT